MEYASLFILFYSYLDVSTCLSWSNRADSQSTESTDYSHQWSTAYRKHQIGWSRTWCVSEFHVGVKWVTSHFLCLPTWDKVHSSEVWEHTSYHTICSSVVHKNPSLWGRRHGVQLTGQSFGWHLLWEAWPWSCSWSLQFCCSRSPQVIPSFPGAQLKSTMGWSISKNQGNFITHGRR